MAVVYNTTLKNTRMTDVVTAIDAGASAGKLIILTSGDVELVSVTLSDPCGTVSGGVLTFSGTPLSGTASQTGTAAKAKIVDSDDTDIVTGLTVSTSDADVNLSTTSINSGNVVNITSATITHG